MGTGIISGRGPGEDFGPPCRGGAYGTGGKGVEGLTMLRRAVSLFLSLVRSVFISLDM